MDFQTLRQKAALLKEEAQIAYLLARDTGQDPDRQKILFITQKAKALEKQALAFEDQSHLVLNNEPMEISQAQQNTWNAGLLISKVEDRIYLSGYDALENDTCLVDRHITHILSICQYYLPRQNENYVCKSVPVLDTLDQDLLQYFPECIAFIEAAKRDSGSLLIHCHAGQSRSVTVVAAYLMHRDKIGMREALARIQNVRKVQPNDNFLQQLKLFEECDCQIADDNVQYRRWKFEHMFKGHSKTSDPLMTSVTANGLTTYQETDSSSRYTQIRCKKCRFILASENHIIHHEPKSQPAVQPESQQSSLIAATCAHFFLEPIRWMKPELDKGQLDGRFTCPNLKCNAKIGSYAWQGSTCSCLRWVLPALCIQRSKVDELKSKTPVKMLPPKNNDRDQKVKAR